LRHCQKRLSILHNYFDDPTKLFSDLYPAKFLDTSAKPFFLCTSNYMRAKNADSEISGRKKMENRETLEGKKASINRSKEN